MSRINLMAAMILLLTVVLIALVEMVTLARSADATPMSGASRSTMPSIHQGNA